MIRYMRSSVSWRHLAIIIRMVVRVVVTVAYTLNLKMMIVEPHVPFLSTVPFERTQASYRDMQDAEG